MHVCMHVGVNVCMHACMYFSLKLAHVGALGFFSSTLHVLPVPSDFSNFALPVPMLNRFLKSCVFLVFYSVSWILAVPGDVLLRLGALGPHLVAKLRQNGAKMAPKSSNIGQVSAKMGQHSAKMAQHSVKIAQHSAKIAQHSVQEQPQEPKKPSKVLYCRRFFDFRNLFVRSRPKLKKHVAKMLQEVPKWRQGRRTPRNLTTV